MAALKFFKVLELPAEPEAHSFYFVKNGDFAEHYLTDASGEPHGVGNTEFIEYIVDEKLEGSLAGFSKVEVVADIEARDELEVGESNFLVLVLDASDDATVDAGAALYVYHASEEEFVKVSEYESLDLTLNWSDIVGRPSSSASAIDAAVADSHTHENKSVLDELDDDDGVLTYNGEPIVQWDANEW